MEGEAGGGAEGRSGGKEEGVRSRYERGAISLQPNLSPSYLDIVKSRMCERPRCL